MASATADSKTEAAVSANKAELQLESLTKLYGDVGAVRGLSLDVAAGEFVSLLGPSGSGKTTTLMAVAGFVTLDGGRILLGGRDITNLQPHRRNLGVVFQNYALFPHMTVGANIAFPLEVRRVPRQEIKRRVAAILDLVQLPGMEKRMPRQLSGGQQQRVAIARALVHDPPLLLMDEPLGALDRKLREQMQLEIKRIHQRVGITVVYVTHDRDEAMTMSTHIAVVRDGRIVQMGTPPDVYSHPKNRFVAEFLGDANILKSKVTAHNSTSCDLRLDAGGTITGVAADVSTDSPVNFAVRPERIRFCGADEALLTGVVAEAVYHGQATRYVVRVPGLDRPLQVERSNDELSREIVLGDSVSLTWRVVDLSVLAEAEGQP